MLSGNNMNHTSKITVSIWLVFGLAMIIFADHHRTVSIEYWQAAHHWLAQQPLYNHSGRGFIYLPQSALLYTPLALLPLAWSEAIWRILSVTVFVWGLFRLTPLFTPEIPQKRQAVLLLIVSLPLLLLGFDSVRNGQMHLLMTGLLMSATAYISQKQWLKATFLITLGFFLKPTAVVFLLLVMGVFPVETGLYFLLWGLIFMLAPFLTQSWHYVAGQYSACITMLETVARTGGPQDWAQFFNLPAQFGWQMAPYTQTVVRVIAAGICLLAALGIKYRRNLGETALWLLMLSMVYLMLFNPRTENNDYIMLAPVIGFGLFHSLVNRKFYCLGYLALLIAGLLSSYYLSNLFPHHRNWGAPLMAVLLLIYLAKRDMIGFYRVSL